MVLLWCDVVHAEDQPGLHADIWSTTGEKTSGVLVAIEKNQLTFRNGEANQMIAFADIWQIARVGPPTRPVRPAFWIYLTNGDRWGVRSLQMAGEELEFEIPGDNQPRKIGIASVAGIQPVRSGTSWRSDESEWLQVARHHAKSDLAVLRNGDHQTGEISAIDDKGLTLSGSLGMRSLEWTAVGGLLLNPDLAEVLSPAPEGWTVLLNDESWLTVSSIRQTSEGNCQLTTVQGVEWSAPLAGIRWMSHWSPVSTPLSRVPITAQKHQPLLGESLNVAIDHNARGLPLRRDSALVPADHAAANLPALSPLGLGLTSGMSVQWTLDGNYRRLLCGLCLDATACPEGHAIIELSADNQPPWKVTLKAGEPLILETSFNLTGVQTLTIETEYGENSDACDWINLITPVLVK